MYFQVNMQYILISFVLNVFCFRGVLSKNEFVTITTPHGQIQGVKSTTEGNNTLFAFLGMRYAAAPVGALRFRAPRPPPAWTGVYNATEHGSQCYQSFSPMLQGDEDCLFINVYTTQLPSNSSKQAPLPVMIWFHGGAYLLYSGDLELHGADRLLDHGVLVVSFNYRLGVFGFLCTQDDAIPGNYAIKDQLLALQWVQENIASFGGDPEQVTLWGESAGADSVHYLRQLRRAKGLFHRVIAQSGSTLNPWAVANDPRNVAFRLGVEHGIETEDSTRLVEALRNISGEKLHRSMFVPGMLKLFEPLNGLPFAPCLEVESEEAVYTKYSYETQKSGDFNYGPLLHGFNSLEARDFVNKPWLVKFLLGNNGTFCNLLAPRGMKASESDRITVDQNIRSLYFHNKSVTMGPDLTNFVSEGFIRGIVQTSQLESHYTNVYLYRFSFTGGAHHTRTIPQGVSHYEEMQYLLVSPDYVQHSPAAQLTMRRVLQMWTNFVKTGNPTPGVSEAVNITWPLSNATGYEDVHYLDIGEELVTSVNPKHERMMFWEEQFSTYGQPPYNTY